MCVYGCAGYTGSLYAGIRQQMIVNSPEFSPLLPPASSSSSSSLWNDDTAAAFVGRVKSEEVCRNVFTYLGRSDYLAERAFFSLVYGSEGRFPLPEFTARVHGPS